MNQGITKKMRHTSDLVVFISPSLSEIKLLFYMIFIQFDCLKKIVIGDFNLYLHDSK